MPASLQPAHGPASRDALLAELRASAPAGLRELDPATRARLRDVTARLLAALPDATAECTRLAALRGRRLAARPADGVAGRVVLVTGGSGCVGSAVAAALRDAGASRVVSLARGRSPAWREDAPDQTVRADVADRDAVAAAIRQVRPDVVVHLAAERNAAAAEQDVRACVATNVLGTRNVLAACEAAGVGRLVYASTGKALWPYTPHVYGATKRIGEWLVARAAARGLPCAVARFTHIVDNSLVVPRFRAAAAAGLVRLHDEDIRFYAQSAAEAADLLLLAAGGARAGATPPLLAIRDLALPLRLTELALGTLAAVRPDAALYVCGYEPGYTATVYPGLYAPETAVDASALLNAFEAHLAEPAPGAAEVDRSRLVFAPSRDALRAFAALEAACVLRAPDEHVRASLDRLARSVLDAALAAVPGPVLARAASLAAPYRSGLTAADRVIDDGVRCTLEQRRLAAAAA